MTDTTNDLSRTTLVHRTKELEERLAAERARATLDALTGLGNLRALNESDFLSFVVMADLNGFKAAQDKHPDRHAYGDRILIEFATFLRSITRTVDTTAASDQMPRMHDVVAYRKGGDEFAVLCDTQGASRILDAIRKWRSKDGRVTASAGSGANMEVADAALYADKERWKAAASMLLYAPLHCPNCRAPHIDHGKWAHKPHHTHLCEFCRFEWRVEPYVIGV